MVLRGISLRPFLSNSLNRDCIVRADQQNSLVTFGIEQAGVDDPGLFLAHLKKLGKRLGTSTASLTKTVINIWHHVRISFQTGNLITAPASHYTVKPSYLKTYSRAIPASSPADTVQKEFSGDRARGDASRINRGIMKPVHGNS